MIHQVLGGTPTSYPAASATATTPTRAAAAKATATSSEKLRCPRCDSGNTKFCYYNNYNLTQPRHFCKSCRRYWTKGGTLRHVPIGGGCRKHKAGPVNLSNSAARFNSSSKFRNIASEIERFGFEKDLPGLGAPARNSQNPNALLPNFVKADPFLGIGHTVFEPSGPTNCRPVGFSSDPLGPVHTLGRSRNGPQNGLLVPEELYQRRLRLSTDHYGSDNAAAAPAAGAEFAFWNCNVPAFAFMDLLNN